MDPATLISLDILAAAVLALWVVVRFPRLGPKSLLWAAAAFIGGQCLPSLGAPMLVPVLHLPHGLALATVGIVLPVFFGWFLTVAWLFRAIIGGVGRGGGGHRARPPRTIARVGRGPG